MFVYSKVKERNKTNYVLLLRIWNLSQLWNDYLKCLRQNVNFENLKECEL